MIRRALVAVLMLALATACSSGSTKSADPATVGKLRADVQALVQAAAKEDYPAANAALATLRSDLAAAEAADSITSAKAAQIHAAITSVTTDLATATRVPSPSTSTTPPPTTAPSTGDQHSKDDGKTKGKSKGKDH